MVRTQVQLTEDQYEALKRIASQQRVSMAELVRRGVEEVIKISSRPDLEERRARFMAVAGKYSSGLSDVSARHDDYFAEAIESSKQ